MLYCKTPGFSGCYCALIKNWQLRQKRTVACAAACCTAQITPRKPRACPTEVRADFESRFSFCCHRCRRRTTSMSVRFLGRRVYLGLAVELLSARHAGQTGAAAKISGALDIPVRTLERWRHWWPA